VHAILTEFSKVCLHVSKSWIWLVVFFLPTTLTALSLLLGSVCICWSAFPHLLRISSRMLCPSEHMTVLSPRSVPPGSLNLGKKCFHSEVGAGKRKSPCSTSNYVSGDRLTWLWMRIEREENKAFFFPFLVFFL